MYLTLKCRLQFFKFTSSILNLTDYLCHNLITNMKIEKYQTTNESDGLKYFFDSIGKETIEKVVVYQHLSMQSLIERGLPPQMQVYNLAFGDRIAGTDDFSDQIASNNGDMEMVLSTVADTTFYFWEGYPQANLFLTGSSVSRTYLYQKKIERYWDEINEVAYVAGRLNSQFELFKKGKTYDAFLIIRKR